MLVLGTGVVFSFGALFFRATDDIGPWQYLTFRGLGAAAVAVPFFLFKNRRNLSASVAAIERVHLGAGVMLGAMLCVFIVALSQVDTAFILFFQTLAPIGSGIFSWLILGERMSRQARIATAISLAGVTVMVAGGLDAGVGWSIVLVLSLPTMLGLFPVLIRSGSSMDPIVPVMIGGTVAATISFFVSVAGPGLDVSAHDMWLGLIAGAALVGIPVPFLNLGQRAVLAPEANLLLMTEIVLAPIWVWLAYNEQPTAATMAGGLVILLAVVWLTLEAIKSARAPRTSS